MSTNVSIAELDLSEHHPDQSHPVPGKSDLENEADTSPSRASWTESTSTVSQMLRILSLLSLSCLNQAVYFPPVKIPSQSGLFRSLHMYTHDDTHGHYSFNFSRHFRVNGELDCFEPRSEVLAEQKQRLEATTRDP